MIRNYPKEKPLRMRAEGKAKQKAGVILGFNYEQLHHLSQDS